MKKLLFKFLILVVAAGAIVGCRTSPVYNVDHETVVANVKHVRMSDVKKAIKLAGASLGWSMKDVKPGHMIGTLLVRGNMAQVDINYSTKSYSITYKNSQGLHYDGTNIHNFYNNWIRNLQRKIDVQLSIM